MLDLTDILMREGSTMQFTVTPELTVLSYRFGDFPVREVRPCILQIEHTSDRKLAVTGSASLVVEIPCARCLEPVLCTLQIEPDLEIDLKENEYIDGDYLDVDQLIHDEALLVWPERTLCRSDCRGLCVRCGKNLNEGPCSCDTVSLDPRMAKILDIFRNDKEV